MNRKFTAALATIAVVLSAGVLGAQTYTLTVVGPGTTSVGSSFDTAAVLDFEGPDNMSGWSYGVCNDPAFVACVGSALGSTTATVNGGGAPGFAQGDVFPGGYTQGIVIDLLGASSLAPGTGYELSVGNYTAVAETAATPVSFCATLGTPPVDAVVVINGQSVVPTFISDDVEIVGVPDPVFTYIAEAADGGDYPAPSGIGGNTYTVQFSVAEADQSPGLPFPSDTQGFSLAASNDAALITPVAVNAVGALAALNGGSGPEFFQVGLFADAWSSGIVYALTGGATLGFSDAGDAVISVDYEGVAGALTGVEGTTTTPIVWNSNIGVPPVSLVIVVSGASFAAGTVDGSLSVTGVVAIPFRRGDSNVDGIVNIADIISNLDQQFNGVPTPCMLANDADDSGAVDIGDPIYQAAYIFQGGPPPPAPFPNCGTVAGQTPGDCVTYNNCP